jgi:polar amino acid transport system substrate-binding protein
MRVTKMVVAMAAAGLVLAACASSGPAATDTTPGASPITGSPSASPTPSACAADALHLVTPATLTVGTDNPAYPPFFSGGETKDHAEWKLDDPYTGKGFEDAVAYAVANQLGFDDAAVTWVVAPFNQTYAPGPKQYDFAIEQISYSAKRAKAVDFSDSYYDVNQALVAVKGTPIASATTLAQLKDYTLAAPIGTTSYDYIKDTIQPNKEPGAYNTLSDTVAALNAHQIDALLVDLPTALYIADPYVQEVKKSVVVGQFAAPSGTTDHTAMAFEKGNPLVACVNQALAAVKASGQLEQIQQTWLSENTNVGTVPFFSTS